MLTPGLRLELPKLGGRWRVGRVLGEGGQGSVYELLAEPASRASLALKWYRPEASHPDQRANLVRLSERPGPSREFLWPLEVIDGPNGSFGYVMPIRPPAYRPLADLLTGAVDVGFATVTRLSLGLVHSFLMLHSEGLCYRDISLGNVFFDPATGRALICDNDNVGIDRHSRARVLGTARFMAPEIVRGAALPSSETDLYSLAVLIFYVLMNHHPLQGRRELAYACLDRAAEAQMFGYAPLFVFDPTDADNAPDPSAHAAVLRYWPLYPGYLQEQFVRAFTVGLADPAQRVRESVWRARLSRLLDGIVVCACGRENFTDDARVGRCWSCQQPIPDPVHLDIDGRILVLNDGTRLTRHHLTRDYDVETELGRVQPHPSQPDRWGLTNTGGQAWRVRLPGSEVREVEPGRSIGLVPGAEIAIGGVRLRVRRHDRLPGADAGPPG